MDNTTKTYEAFVFNGINYNGIKNIIQILEEKDVRMKQESLFVKVSDIILTELDKDFAIKEVSEITNQIKTDFFTAIVYSFNNQKVTDYFLVNNKLPEQLSFSIDNPNHIKITIKCSKNNKVDPTSLFYYLSYYYGVDVRINITDEFSNKFYQRITSRKGQVPENIKSQVRA